MTQQTGPNKRKGDPMVMSIERFRAVLDAYGAAPERWPVEERQSALDLLEASPDARRAREEAAALDLVLDDQPAPPATVALRRRLEEAYAGSAAARPRRLSRLFGAGWSVPFFGARPFRPAYIGLAATVLVVGFAMGLLSADLASDTPADRLAGLGGDYVPADVYDEADAESYQASEFNVSDLGITVRRVEYTLLPTEPESDLAELPIE